MYCINHIFQGLSDGIKGGDNRYFVTSHDYGSGFVETLKDSDLVHLILVQKCDSLSLRLGSRWTCITFDIWGFIIWIYVEVWPWKRLPTCEGKPA